MRETVKFGEVEAGPGKRVTGVLGVGELDQLSFARGQLELPLIVVNGAQDGPTLFLLAGQHSGEYVGMETIISVTREVVPAQLSGCIVGIPVMNPLGFAAKVPYVCPLDNLNMNRLWPGTSGGTVGQRIAYAVWNEIVTQADYLIDLHGGDFPEYQSDYAICFITEKSELDTTSERMARHFGLPYIRRSAPSEGSAPTGPSARMAMKLLDIPAIVPELGDAGVLNRHRLDKSVSGVVNVMKLLEMIPGEPATPPADQKAMVSRTSVFSSRHGLVRHLVEINEYIRKEQPIAEVSDFYGETQEILYAPCDGMVCQVFYQSATNSGNIVMKIAAIESL